MSALIELTKKVCDRLGILDGNQRKCIEDILKNTVQFNEYRNGTLDESRMEAFITVLGGYVSEISMIADDPQTYHDKLQRIKLSLQRTS